MFRCRKVKKEEGEEVGMLEDMAVGISDLQKVLFKITEAKSDVLLPVITGRRGHYVIEIKLPEKMFELLPQEIKEGKLLHVYPVLFNVGINEQQTLAERFGDTSLQENVNQENLELLKEYYKLFTEKMPPDYQASFRAKSQRDGENALISREEHGFLIKLGKHALNS
ncbi:hypothetical protein lerEdw1_012239 [Lerista edwardsae]|nr:hypothetical protein lerEdw1_012239 [Lerista edwardsae]